VKIFGVFILIMAMASPAFVRAFVLDSNGRGVYTDIGSTTCGQWILRRETEVLNPARVSYCQMYVLGFLNSYNRYTENMYNILGGSDLESATLFVDKHCRGNPLSYVDTGMIKLVGQLFPLAYTKHPENKKN